MMIQPIVEGHGEVKAARVLLRRLIREVNAWDIDIDRPIRCNRNKRLFRLSCGRDVTRRCKQGATGERTLPP